MLVIDLLERFFTEHPLRPKTLESYKTSMRAWHPYIGQLTVSQVTTKILHQFVSDRLRKLSDRTGRAIKPGTVRADLAFLSSLLGYAALLPGGPQNNVAGDFKKRALKVARPRVRWLEPHQIVTLMACIPSPVHRLIVLFGLEAGLRRSEILNLRVYQVDLTSHNILLRGEGTKSGLGRKVPMSNALCAVVLPHLKGKEPDDLMFMNPKTKRAYRDLRPWWDTAVVKAQLTNFTFHDTRHHFACRFLQKGGRLDDLKNYLGHSTSQMSEKYGFLRESDSEAAFRRLDT